MFKTAVIPCICVKIKALASVTTCQKKFSTKGKNNPFQERRPSTSPETAYKVLQSGKTAQSKNGLKIMLASGSIVH